MLGEYGETLVVDWGVAWLMSQADSWGMEAERPQVIGSSSGSAPTTLGKVVGTEAFMSPGQACGRWNEVGPASDVFSLGATLYALPRGHTPYGGPGRAAPSRRKSRSGKVRPVRPVRPLRIGSTARQNGWTTGERCFGVASGRGRAALRSLHARAGEDQGGREGAGGGYRPGVVGSGPRRPCLAASPPAHPCDCCGAGGGSGDASTVSAVKLFLIVKT
jgi:serine/threonine protein kinase